MKPDALLPGISLGAWEMVIILAMFLVPTLIAGVVFLIVYLVRRGRRENPSKAPPRIGSPPGLKSG